MLLSCPSCHRNTDNKSYRIHLTATADLTQCSLISESDVMRGNTVSSEMCSHYQQGSLLPDRIRYTLFPRDMQHPSKKILADSCQSRAGARSNCQTVALVATGALTPELLWTEQGRNNYVGFILPPLSNNCRRNSDTSSHKPGWQNKKSRELFLKNHTPAQLHR